MLAKKAGTYSVSAAEEMNRVNYVYEMEEQPSLRKSKISTTVLPRHEGSEIEV